MISEKTSNGSASPSRSKPSPASIITSTSGQRVLLIVAGLVSLFFLTKVFFPPDQSPFTIGQHQIQRTETLLPRNYLNVSTASPPPFDFCPIYGPGDAVATKWGGPNLARGRIYTGSGARIQKVIHKALSGLPVTISILGGSGVHTQCRRHMTSMTLISSSISMSRRRRQSDLSAVLSSSALRVVEQRLSSPGIRTYQRRDAQDQLRVFLVLQRAPSTGSNGLGHLGIRF